VPASAVDEHHSAGAGRDLRGDLGEMEVHRGCVDGLRDDRGADTARRANRPKQVGGAATVVAHHGWTRSTLGPDAGETALLAHSGLILKPDLD
jgi:hypothetical protein